MTISWQGSEMRIYIIKSNKNKILCIWIKKEVEISSWSTLLFLSTNIYIGVLMVGLHEENLHLAV